ncbi:MAG: DDE-type integrase/transposase/recombinase [Candidatus Methylomirabilales bacterium]
MDETRRRKQALFRLAVLGPLLNRTLQRGELKQSLAELAAQVWTDLEGKPRRMAAKTLEEWYYRHCHYGFEGLMPLARSDRGRFKVVSTEMEELIVAMKREDPGRSTPVIARELVLAGRMKPGELSVSTIRRLLRKHGLSAPRMELERPARLRWQASSCGELWQADAVHGPKLFDPASGRPVRVKIFTLLDDKSRLVPHLRGDFHESQTEFLTVLMGAVLRRGIPRSLLVDNHPSFSGSDVALACARLGIRLIFTRPFDAPAKGKIERFFRTLRMHVLDRLDLDKVDNLDELNLRLSAWSEGEYNRRPHASLNGRTPLEVWEEDAVQIRWVDEPAAVEDAFTATLKRHVRNDSTCQVRGRFYEVPTHLRNTTVEIGYHLLHPDRLWVQDGPTRVPLREVDTQVNARRRREPSTAESSGAPKTGLNVVEQVLHRLTRPISGKDKP